jgi:hypothetical protein
MPMVWHQQLKRGHESWESAGVGGLLRHSHLAEFEQLVGIARFDHCVLRPMVKRIG